MLVRATMGAALFASWSACLALTDLPEAGDATTSSSASGAGGAQASGTTGPGGGTAPCGDVMNDEDNCGECGHSCGDAACVGGMCEVEVLVGDLPKPRCITHDASFVYGFFDSVGQGQMLRIQQSSGAVEKFPGASGAESILACGMHLGMITGASSAGWVALYDSTPPLGFVGYLKYNAAPQAIVIAGWNEPPAAVWVTVAGNVEICLDNACGLMPDIVSSGHASLDGVAIDQANYYFSSAAEGAVYKRGRSLAGDVVTLASDQASPSVIATDGAHVFFVIGDGMVLRVPVEAGTIECLTDQAGTANSLAVDEHHVYWSDPQNERIARVDKTASQCAGEVLVLAEQQSQPGMVASGDTHVYWMTFTDPGTVARAIK